MGNAIFNLKAIVPTLAKSLNQFYLKLMKRMETYSVAEFRLAVKCAFEEVFAVHPQLRRDMIMTADYIGGKLSINTGTIVYKEKFNHKRQLAMLDECKEIYADINALSKQIILECEGFERSEIFVKQDEMSEMN